MEKEFITGSGASAVPEDKEIGEEFAECGLAHSMPPTILHSPAGHPRTAVTFNFSRSDVVLLTPLIRRLWHTGRTAVCSGIDELEASLSPGNVLICNGLSDFFELDDAFALARKKGRNLPPASASPPCAPHQLNARASAERTLSSRGLKARRSFPDANGSWRTADASGQRAVSPSAHRTHAALPLTMVSFPAWSARSVQGCLRARNMPPSHLSWALPCPASAPTSSAYSASSVPAPP